MLCAECGALLLDFEIENFDDLCIDCFQESEVEGLQDLEDLEDANDN